MAGASPPFSPLVVAPIDGPSVAFPVAFLAIAPADTPAPIGVSFVHPFVADDAGRISASEGAVWFSSRAM